MLWHTRRYADRHLQIQGPAVEIQPLLPEVRVGLRVYHRSSSTSSTLLLSATLRLAFRARLATAGGGSFPGAPPFARAAGTAPHVGGFVHPPPLPQPRARLRRRRQLGSGADEICGDVGAGSLGIISGFGRGWSMERRPAHEAARIRGLVSMAVGEGGSGAASRAFGAAEEERRARRRRQRRPKSVQGASRRGECQPEGRRLDRDGSGSSRSSTTAIRSSTAAAPPTLPDGAKAPAIKSEWEAVLQERLERKLRKPNRMRRARGALAVGEAAVEAATAAEGGGATTPSASPYPTHSSPPSSWLQQHQRQEKQQQIVASPWSHPAATAAASSPTKGQQLGGQAASDAENTSSALGAAGELSEAAGATAEIEGHDAGERWEVGEGEGKVVSKRNYGGSRNRNARKRIAPPPLKKWPPGGPFGASKAVAWHAQQVVQSAVTPMQVIRRVAVPLL